MNRIREPRYVAHLNRAAHSPSNRTRVALALATLIAVGCGDEGADGGGELDVAFDAMDTSTEDTSTRDASVEDVAVDSATDDIGAETDSGAEDAESGDVDDGGVEADVSRGDAEADVDAEVFCTFPSPVLPDDPELAALASNPAQCGQDAFTWLESSRLGEVTAIDDELSYGAPLLTIVTAETGVVPHRPFDYDISMKIVSYMTQDRGELIEATALVAAPVGYDASTGPIPIVLLLHGTTGFNDTCAPSPTLEWQALTAVFASWGYIVVAPDYIGLRSFEPQSEELHPYLVGQATAIASLDAARAAGRMVTDGEFGELCADPRVVAYGGSQGGHAALWVDRLAPYYAPELALDGVFAAIPPADIQAQIERATTQIVDATANTIAFYGAAASWYGLEDELDTFFRADNVPIIREALGAPCGSDIGVEPEDFESPADLFTAEVIAAVEGGSFEEYEEWGCMAAESGLTTTSVERRSPDPEHYGIMIAQASNDRLVHPPIEREAYQELCEAGLPIDYIECEGANHSQGAIWSLPEMGRFIDARFAREPFVRPDGCAAPAAIRCDGTPEDE